MVICSACGESAFVDIEAPPGGGRRSAPHWRARCSDCEREWSFTDGEEPARSALSADPYPT